MKIATSPENQTAPVDLYYLAVKDYLTRFPNREQEILDLYWVDQLEDINQADFYEIFNYTLHLQDMYTITIIQ